MKGLSLEISENRVWLRFESSSGKTALVSPETLAQVRPPSVAEAILEWVEDQKKEQLYAP